MPHPKVKISDNSGNTVDVTESNELKVKLSDSVTVTATDLSVQLDHANDSVQLWGNESAAGSGTARALLTDDGGRLQVDVITAPSTAVTGTFWQATQPISIASAAAVDGSIVTLGAKTDDKNAATNTTSITAMSVLKQISASVQEVDSGQLAAGHTIDCNDSDVNVTNMISGFATSNKQPSLGTAGTASANVITVQGIASMTPLTVDLAGNNDVTVTGTVGHNITGLESDDNPTVGTSAEQLITDGADGATACKRVDIMAHPDNTGYIWVGDSAVSVDGLNGGIRLSPGDFYSMDIDNTGDIYVIATVDTENVCYNYFT